MTTSRERLGMLIGALVALLAFTVLAISVRPAPVDPTDIGRAGLPIAADDATLGPDSNKEGEEQNERVDQRVEAWDAARSAGRAGQLVPTRYLSSATSGATHGWVGERPIDLTTDDWEPSIAADPHAPYVYLLTTRYASETPCPGDCPTPWISLSISTNGGRSWAPAKPLCACPDDGQFDPIIEVVPKTGQVDVLYMNGFHVMFTKSTDHGRTWSKPVKTYGKIAWTDKPILAVSDDGRQVYASFNGPSDGDPFIAHSTDGGATWSQVKITRSNRYVYAFDGDVASDGTVYFAESSLLYRDSEAGTLKPGVEEHVFISRDHGRTWIDKTIATAQPGLACTADGCSPDFYTGHAAISADEDGGLVFLYDAATTFQGKQSIYASRSSDRGRTWSTPTIVSTRGEQAIAPMMESGDEGDVRIAWAETSGGGDVDAWNIWYRRSRNGGRSWSGPVRLSDAGTGAPYKTAAGFAEFYGDYGEMAITDAGKTIATWGEGISYTGPGGVWFNRER